MVSKLQVTLFRHQMEMGNAMENHRETVILGKVNSPPLLQTQGMMPCILRAEHWLVELLPRWKCRTVLQPHHWLTVCGAASMG
mmetsp:Transcript_89354/g.142249  ORF Transcript_89354/g.142249 Transcript_89354/m.142249 type:complete len:83 (-) Transcript_89354:211-459(-)